MGLRPPWSQAAEQAEGEGLPSGGLGRGGGSPPPLQPLADGGQSLLLARSAGTCGAGACEPRLDGLGCGGAERWQGRLLVGSGGGTVAGDPWAGLLSFLPGVLPTGLPTGLKLTK